MIYEFEVPKKWKIFKIEEFPNERASQFSISVSFIEEEDVKAKGELRFHEILKPTAINKYYGKRKKKARINGYKFITLKMIQIRPDGSKEEINDLIYENPVCFTLYTTNMQLRILELLEGNNDYETTFNKLE